MFNVIYDGLLGIKILKTFLIFIEEKALISNSDPDLVPLP